MGPRIFLGLFTLTFLASAGDEPQDRATLKGIKTISVVIDRLPPDLLKEGVTSDGLQGRLIQRLLDAGIPIDPAVKEFVGIRASSVRDSKGPYAVSMTIGLYQPVTLVRDSAVRFAPPTWDVDTVMVAPPKQLRTAAMESIDDLAARFIAAYRSVNPK